MRTVILADCHGRPELITDALTDAGSWDCLVFAGDFLDIGPYARGMDGGRFRYAVIEDGVVTVHDSREARAAA